MLVKLKFLKIANDVFVKIGENKSPKETERPRTKLIF
jgi:hypothetical protein